MAHNGKLMQFNDVAANSDGAYYFINLIKGAQSWTPFGNNVPITPDVLDSNGYPTDLTNWPSGVTTGTFNMPSQSKRPGLYVLRWTGNGTALGGSWAQNAFAPVVTGTPTQGPGTSVTIPLTSRPPKGWVGGVVTVNSFTGGWTGLNKTMAVTAVDQVLNTVTVDPGTAMSGGATYNAGTAKVTSQSSTTLTGGVKNGGNRYIIQPTGYGDGILATIRISAVGTIGSDYPHDMSFYHEDDEDAFNSGNVFSSISKSIWANCGVVRYLALQNNNNQQTTTWRSRKSTTYAYWQGAEYRPSIYSGTSTRSRDTFSVAFPTTRMSDGTNWTSGDPQQGDIVQVMFMQNDYAMIINAVSDGGTNTILTFSTGAADVNDFANGDTVCIRNAKSGAGGSGWSGLTNNNNTWTLSGVSGNTAMIPVDSRSFTGSFDGAVFSGTISGTTLTLTSDVSSGAIRVGQAVAGATPGTTISSGSGQTTGSTWTVNISQTSSVTGTSCTGAIQGASCSLCPPKLKVGSGAEKQILNNYSNSMNGNSAYQIVGNYVWSMATLVFDVDLNGWVKVGGCQTDLSSGLVNGVPEEILVQFAQEIGAHPYFLTPKFACDPMTDWVPNFMTYCKSVQDGGQSWMIPRWEGPNEIFNTFSGFTNGPYVLNKANVWAGGNTQIWYGKTMSCLGQCGDQIWGRAYLDRPGNSTRRYGIVCGVQTATGNSTSQNNNRLETTSFTPPASLTGSWGTITFSAVAAAPAGGSNPYVSHVACATYWNPSCYRQDGSGIYTSASIANAFGGSGSSTNPSFTAASIVNGLMTISGTITGAGLAIGNRVWGGNGPVANGGYIPFANNVTIVPGGNGTTTWQLSDTSINISFSQSLYACADITQADKVNASCIDTVVQATVTGGVNFSITSIISGGCVNAASADSTVPKQYVYGAGVAWGTSRSFSGTYPNYTISGGTLSNGSQTLTIGVFFSITSLINYVFPNFVTWANSHGVLKLCTYEGCYSPDFVSSMSVQEKCLYSAGRLPFSAYQNVRTLYDGFFNAATTAGVGGGFTCEYPSFFLPTAVYPTISPWVGLEDAYVGATNQNWDGIVLQSAAKRRFQCS